MKTKLTIIGTVSVLLLVAGCSAFKSGAPPTALEQKLYQVDTNFTLIPTRVTNTVAGVSTVSTQDVATPQYVYHNGPGVRGAQEIGTTIGNLFGVGGLVGTGIGALASLWGWVRSSKWKGTGATLAQSIETMREFVKGLPNGGVYDNALTQWLQQHQADTDTIKQVMDLLENNVQNDSAQIAAQQIKAIIGQLNPAAVPPSVTKPA